MSRGARAAERAVLGAVFLDQSTLDRVCDIVAPEHFSSAPMGRILQAMIELHDDGQRVDPVSVANHLDSSGDLALVGGIDAIVSLDEMGTALGAESHAGIVSGHARLRDLAQAGSGLVSNAKTSSHDEVNSIVDGAVESLLSISDNSDIQLIPVNDAVRVAMKETRERHENKTSVIGVPTGMSRLDSILGGYLASNLYILSAATGKGKSAFGLGAALAAAHKGNRVVYVSLEMSSTDLARRLIAIEAQVDGENIRTGYLSELERVDIISAAKTLTNLGDMLTIIDKPGLHVSSLRRICRRQNATAPVDMIVVDYLQLLDADQAYSRERQVASISGSLLRLCRESECPVVALSQINADGQVRESRAVEHDAAAILRIDYETETDLDQLAPDCVIRVLKHRHGRTGNVHATFFRNKQTFVQRASGPFG